MHAKSAYCKVIELRENFLDAYKNLCIIYVRSEEPQNAIDLALKALEFEKEDYTLYYIVGTAYMSMKNFEESVKYLEKALELNPEHSQLYNNLGTSYITIGQLDKAYENFLKASEFDPENSITYFNIASILQLQNNLSLQDSYQLPSGKRYLSIQSGLLLRIERRLQLCNRDFGASCNA